jgi:hypothetical protein
MAALSMPERLRAWPARCVGASYRPSVIATGSQAAYKLPGTVGCGPSGGQPALSTTAATVPLPSGWTRTSTDMYNNGNTGTISNCDFTGFTFWFSGNAAVTLNNCLFKGPPGANDDLFLQANDAALSSGRLNLNNVTFDGSGITTYFYGYVCSFGTGNGASGTTVTCRYCLWQNVPWSPIQISCNTDIQFCFFGPSSLKAINVNHTDTIFCHGGTHTHSNNLFDFTMPAQDGQATLVQGPEGWFCDTNVSSVALTCSNNIWRGLSSYEAAGASVNYIWSGGRGGVFVRSFVSYVPGTGIAVVDITTTSSMNVGDTFQLNGLTGTGTYAAFQNKNYTISRISGTNVTFTGATGIGAATFTGGYFNDFALSCTINANNNAVERASSGYYSMIAGGTFNNGGNNRDYDTNVAF